MARHRDPAVPEAVYGLREYVYRRLREIEDLLQRRGTRMMWHLLHGNLPEAARHHLPALIAVPVVGYAWARWTASTMGRWLPALPLPRWLLIAYAASWAVFAIARNLPWPPFTGLHLTDIQ